jgi:hypothetical protein
MARFVNPRDFVQNLDVTGAVNRAYDSALNAFNQDEISRSLQENASAIVDQLNIAPRALNNYNIDIQEEITNFREGPLSLTGFTSLMGEIDNLPSSFRPSTPTRSPAPATPGSEFGYYENEDGSRATNSLPLPNHLKGFTSYNYILTLAVLTNEELNLPDQTIRQGPPKHIVMRSTGGAGRDNDSLTAFETNGNKIEFFMDDLSIKSVVAPNNRSRHSTATQISFRVTEPYSMGLLPQALELACIAAGHRNYLEAPMAITIEFQGYDSNGNAVPLPDERRVIACKWMQGQFNAGQSGSIYEMKMVPYNELAFSDVVQTTPIDIALHGRTLNEMLQTGVQSLASIINKHLLDNQENTYVHEQDDYIFVFPKDRASFTQLLESSIRDQGATIDPSQERQQREFDRLAAYQTITTGQIQELDYASQEQLDTFWENQTGFTLRRSNLSEAIKQYNESDENVNDLGAARIRLDDPLGPGANPYIVANYEEEDGLFVRDSIVIDPTTRQIKFKQGTKIQRIIEELVCISDAGIDIGPNAEPDNLGMVPWFRIESQVFNIKNTSQAAQSGRDPRVYVYRVVPYKVHHSVFAAPNQPYTGYDELYRQAAKEYDYIYTGKNDDILDFNLQFRNTFYAALSSDGENRASNTGPQEGAAVVDDGFRGSAADTGQGNQPEGAATLERDPNNIDSASAGAVAETPAVRTARRFNDAIVNSNVDLLVADLVIWGDPFWLSDSGMGNYIARPSQLFNVNSDVQADYQNGQNDIIINFKTPIDITSDGTYSFASDYVDVQNFSGLYMVTSVTSMFEGGKFTQEMHIIRRRNQRLQPEATQESASPLQELRVPERLIAAMQDAGATPDEIRTTIESNIEQFGTLNVQEIVSNIPGLENTEALVNSITSEIQESKVAQAVENFNATGSFGGFGF